MYKIPFIDKRCPFYSNLLGPFNNKSASGKGAEIHAGVLFVPADAIAGRIDVTVHITFELTFALE